MMAESKDYPPVSQPQQGGFLFNYNVQEIERESEKFYKYDSVFVKKMTREELVPAIIRTKYTINDEFKLNALDRTDPEYVAYRDFVNWAKGIVDAALQ